MTIFKLTLLEEQLAAIRNHVLRTDKKERVAYIFLRSSHIDRDPWTGQPTLNFLGKEILPVSDEGLISFSETHVTWRTDSVVQALKYSRAIDGTLAIVHSHPLGGAMFSAQDDSNEADLIQLAHNRNGPNERIVSLLITPDERPVARIWINRKRSHSISDIRILGDRFHFFVSTTAVATSKAFQRQTLAFGRGLTQILRGMRVGVVGCGATGSAVAMLLARLGVGNMLLIDRDTVDITNLNRLHGAGAHDARAKRPKTAVVSRMVRAMGLGVNVKTLRAWIGDRRCRNALKACDVVFGCTDDHDGRLLLNRFAYYYLIPVIDMGLAIEVSKDDPPTVKALDGRVTVLLPGNTCLMCRDVVNPARALAESLKRNDPKEYERRKAEAYVLGEGDPNPAVVTFTTEVATLAVNEFLQRLTGFRGPSGANAQRVRLFHRMQDLRPGSTPQPTCPVCGARENWALGDTDPFLGRVG